MTTQAPKSNSETLAERRKELRKQQLVRHLENDAAEIARIDQQIAQLKAKRADLVSKKDDRVSAMARELAPKSGAPTLRRGTRPGVRRPKRDNAALLRARHENKPEPAKPAETEPAKPAETEPAKPAETEPAKPAES